MAIIGLLSEITRNGIRHSGVSQAVQYLRSLPADILHDAAEGFTEKIALNGPQLTAIHQVYRSKYRSRARLEAHRIHIDVQYIVSGCEHILWAPRQGLSAATEYDAARDIIFFTEPGQTVLRLSAGMAAVFFPEDAHAPGVCTTRPEPIKKIVIKIAC